MNYFTLTLLLTGIASSVLGCILGMKMAKSPEPAGFSVGLIFAIPLLFSIILSATVPAPVICKVVHEKSN